MFQSNILFDDEGKALLADFGLSNIVVEPFGPSYVTSSIGGSVRWAAPEHFRISDGDRISTVTTHGDIYSYGSVMLQVRTINIAWQFFKFLNFFFLLIPTYPGFTLGIIRKATISLHR